MYMSFPHLVEVFDELVGEGRLHSYTGVAWDRWVDGNFVSRVENRSWMEVKDWGDGRLALGCNISSCLLRNRMYFTRLYVMVFKILV